MCTHERSKRDDEMLGVGVGVVETSEKTEAERERQRVGSWSEKPRTDEGAATLTVRRASSERPRATSESNWRRERERE